MAFTPEGDLLVVSRSHPGAIFKIDVSAGEKPVVSKFYSSPDLCNPSYIAVDPGGFVYVDTGRPTVVATTRGYAVAHKKVYIHGLFRINPLGTDMIRIEELEEPTTGLAFDPGGQLFACNYVLPIEEEFQPGRVAERSSDKVFGGAEDLRPYIMRCEQKGDSPASLDTKILEHLEEMPTDITFDREGNLVYVAAHNVVKMSFGLFGAKAEPLVNLKARYRKAHNSTGICIDETGALYVGLNNPYIRMGGTVVRIASDGTVSTFAEKLGTPADIVADNAGNIYISDMKKNTVFRVAAAVKNSPTPFRPAPKPPKPAPEPPAEEAGPQEEEPAAQEGENAGVEPEQSPAEQPAAEQEQATPDMGSERRTELFIEAAKRGNVGAVLRDLNRGIYPDVKDHNRRTPLMLAAFEGHDRIVEILLSKGANLRARDVDGWTALMYAAYGGRTSTVRLLIAEGADVNARVRSGQSVIAIAEQKGHQDVIEVLTEAGARR
jgi:hypothetical protein